MSTPANKKLYFALGFLAVAVTMVYMAFRPGNNQVAASKKTAPTSGRQSAMQILNETATGTGGSGGRKARSAAGSTIDPTLRLDLLAKVQGIKYEGGERNIFQFYSGPPKGIPKPVAPPEFVGPLPPEAPPPPPPPPPIPLKFFGFASAPGETPVRAFLSDQDDVAIVSEGDLIKKRYKVIKISPNNIEMEDTQTKSRQKLPLQET